MAGCCGHTLIIIFLDSCFCLYGCLWQQTHICLFGPAPNSCFRLPVSTPHPWPCLGCSEGEHSQHIDWRYYHVTTSNVHAACVLWLLQAQSNMPLHLIDLYNFKPPADLIVNREESQAIRINAAKTSLVRICGCGIACIRRSAQLPASTAACQPTMPERWPCLAPECWTA